MYYCAFALMGEKILDHCNEYPENTYIFQTKNPKRYHYWLDKMPKNIVLGCTIETSDYKLSKKLSSTPFPDDRAREMMYLPGRLFITIEPILKGDMDLLVDWIKLIKPEFVNVGADSKGTGLEEPSPEEILSLIDGIMEAGIEIRGKHNLKRILGEELTQKVMAL